MGSRFSVELWVSLVFFCIILASAIVSVGMGVLYGSYKRDMPNVTGQSVFLFSYYRCISNNNTDCDLLLYDNRSKKERRD